MTLVDTSFMHYRMDISESQCVNILIAYWNESVLTHVAINLTSVHLQEVCPQHTCIENNCENILHVEKKYKQIHCPPIPLRPLNLTVDGNLCQFQYVPHWQYIKDLSPSPDILSCRPSLLSCTGQSFSRECWFESLNAINTSTTHWLCGS